MMIDSVNTNGLRGKGFTNRDVILNEIQEARQELRRLSNALTMLETIVRTKPDEGAGRVGDPQVPRMLTEDQMKPLLGWIISLFESFLMIYFVNSHAGQRARLGAELESWTKRMQQWAVGLRG